MTPNFFTSEKARKKWNIDDFVYSFKRSFNISDPSKLLFNLLTIFLVLIANLQKNIPFLSQDTQWTVTDNLVSYKAVAWQRKLQVPCYPLGQLGFLWKATFFLPWKIFFLSVYAPLWRRLQLPYWPTNPWIFHWCHRNKQPSRNKYTSNQEEFQSLQVHKEKLCEKCSNFVLSECRKNVNYSWWFAEIFRIAPVAV